MRTIEVWTFSSMYIAFSFLGPFEVCTDVLNETMRKPSVWELLLFKGRATIYIKSNGVTTLSKKKG